jgi:hypothetical protein
LLSQGRKQNLIENVWCAQNREKGGNLFTDFANVKQVVFRCFKASHSSNSIPVVFIAPIQHTHFMRWAYTPVFSDDFNKNFIIIYPGVEKTYKKINYFSAEVLMAFE